MEIKTGARCRVVEYQSGSLPITLDALPGDVEQGEKMAKLLIIAMKKFRANGKVTIQTSALGRIDFWETRARARRGGVVKHTYHIRHEELRLEFGSPGYHDLRRWIAVATQLLGSGYPCMIASFDGKGFEFNAPNGQALDAE